MIESGSKLAKAEGGIGRLQYESVSVSLNNMKCSLRPK